MSAHAVFAALRGGMAEAEDKMFKIAGVGALFAWGATVPTDGEAGYAPGCIFINTAGATVNRPYCNVGSVTSCDFNLITVAA